MENGEIESVDEEMPSRGGRSYTRVVSHEQTTLQLSPIDVISSSGVLPKQGRTNFQEDNTTVESEGTSNGHEVHGELKKESKLELFGFDSLVNILGLKSMSGEPIPAPSSPRDGEDVAITLGHPKETGLKLGTMMGVFVPCLQNILGIIYYIRFSWIVGMGGIGDSLLLVSFCGACTFLTAISLSAIATNGAMKGGGPYYLIGRALGPEVGVSIGLCFFLGNAVAGALYVLGAVETFLDAVPSAGFFRESVVIVSNITLTNGTATNVTTTTVSTPSLHDLQLYGVVVTILLCFIVFGGVKIINKVAPAFLIPVLFSLFCIFIGVLVAPRSNAASGITGLKSQSFRDNWSSDYQRTTNSGVPDPEGSIYWNFNALVGLFFPAVTGIMAGSNRSASLKDTQRSIPVGTLAATLTTTFLYLISVLLFGALATREELLTNRLLTAEIAWPVPAIVYVGIILSTLGAALQRDRKSVV